MQWVSSNKVILDERKIYPVPGLLAGKRVPQGAAKDGHSEFEPISYRRFLIGEVPKGAIFNGRNLVPKSLKNMTIIKPVEILQAFQTA